MDLKCECGSTFRCAVTWCVGCGKQLLAWSTDSGQLCATSLAQPAGRPNAPAPRWWFCAGRRTVRAASGEDVLGAGGRLGLLDADENPCEVLLHHVISVTAAGGEDVGPPA